MSSVGELGMKSCGGGDQSSSRLRTQVCATLVMDSTDPDITIDENGICNHWHEWKEFVASLPTPDQKRRMLEESVARIRAAGRGKPYDSIIGLSGGVD